MTKHNFIQKELFKGAWGKVKDNAWFLFTVFLLSAVLMTSLNHSGLVEFLAAIATSISLVAVSLSIAHGHTPSYHDLIKHFKNAKVPVNYTLATLLYILIVLVGFAGMVALLSVLATIYTAGFQQSMSWIIAPSVLAILVSLYFVVRLQFYKFLIVEDENLLPFEALKKSMDITRGHFFSIFFFMIVIILINCLGAIPLGLGLIFTIPFSLVVYALVYKKLASHE